MMAIGQLTVVFSLIFVASAELTDLVLTQTSNTSLTASWTDTQNGSLVEKYQVKVTSVETGVTTTHETPTTNISLDNLEVFMEYIVEVATVVGGSVGPAISGKVKTWPGPGGIPTKLTAIAGTTSLTINWEDPSGRAMGEFMYYVATVFEKNGHEIYRIFPILNKTCTVENLKPARLYGIEVRRRNKHLEPLGYGGGLSEPATLEVETLPAGSFEPRNGTLENIAPSSVKVSWSPPEGLIGTVKGYHILAKDKDKIVRKVSVHARERSVVVTNLDPTQKYQFYVQAHINPNNQGMGGGLSREVLIPETTSSPDAGGLSGAAIVAIVICVLLAIVLVMFITFRLRKRSAGNVLIDEVQLAESEYTESTADDMEAGAIGSAKMMVKNVGSAYAPLA